MASLPSILGLTDAEYQMILDQLDLIINQEKTGADVVTCAKGYYQNDISSRNFAAGFLLGISVRPKRERTAPIIAILGGFR